MSCTVGVDVGGTKIAAGLVDEHGQVVARERTESPATDPKQIVRTIGELVRSLTGSETVEAVGVSAAGFVDKARAMVVFAPNLAWRDEPLKRFLEEELELPVVVENDANAAAWGEFTFGAGEDVDDLLMLTVGTGVGGGLVIDGELVRGGFGMGGEVGHITMVPGGVPCGCGNLGCLESYGSGRALVRVSRELAGSDPESAKGLVARAGGRPGQDHRSAGHGGRAGGRPLRDRAAGGARRLARSGRGHAHRRARPQRGGDRRRRQRGRRPAPRPDPRQLRAARHRPRTPADAGDTAGEARQCRRHDRRRRPGETPVSTEWLS